VNGAVAELTARAIIDTSLYLILATADGTGRPWSSPVYFAHHRYAEFLWVSAPQAAHSRNIAVRPQVGIVIFDSHAPIGAGQGVYISAVAELVGGDDLTQGMETFSRRSLTHGGARWTVRDVHADLLRQLRTEARLTQEELAEEAGLSPRSVSDLERGINRTARKDSALMLATALKLSGEVQSAFVAGARGRAELAGRTRARP
jgi:DNA-binding XRE family transcriptional regulator